MSIFFICNNTFYKEGEPVITPDGRSLKYGDGLFETIKMADGKILLSEYHFDRLFSGMKILSFQVLSSFTREFLENEIVTLATKNGHLGKAKIRLMVFRGNGSLREPENDLPNYIIQTWHLPSHYGLNSRGLVLDVYHGVKKSCDILANLKTNNFLPYALAAKYAKSNNLDDCIVLNNLLRICDTSVANIFIIKKQHILTPPLSEGCIAGVMRRWVLWYCKHNGIALTETPLSIDELAEADEMFLTNAVTTLAWVERFKDVHYGNAQIKLLYAELVKTF